MAGPTSRSKRGSTPEEAQADLWQDGPNVPLAQSVAPSASARRVPGGHSVSGASPFISGVTHAERVGVGAMVPHENGPPEWLWFLMPEGIYEVRDVWQTVALRGTGSNLVLTDNAMVPDSQVVRVTDMLDGTAPGGLVNANEKFRLPFVSYAGIFITSVMLGAALGALNPGMDAPLPPAQ